MKSISSLLPGQTKQFFLFSRAPKLSGIPKKWTRPSEEDYQKALINGDFLSTSEWTPEQIAAHPVIVQDLKTLDLYLLPLYFKFSQQAKYYQNRFYLDQWILIWGAFITTAAGIVSASVSNSPDLILSKIFGFVATIIGGIVTIWSAINNQYKPQQHWIHSRRLAEELRANYFKYLSHLPPYDIPERVQKLRESVLEIESHEKLQTIQE